MPTWSNTAPRLPLRHARADSDNTLIEIRIGSLDDAPFEVKPEDEIWVKRRESWIPPVDGAAQHDES